MQITIAMLETLLKEHNYILDTLYRFQAEIKYLRLDISGSIFSFGVWDKTAGLLVYAHKNNFESTCFDENGELLTYKEAIFEGYVRNNPNGIFSPESNRFLFQDNKEGIVPFQCFYTTYPYVFEVTCIRYL